MFLLILFLNQRYPKWKYIKKYIKNISLIVKNYVWGYRLHVTEPYGQRRVAKPYFYIKF